MREFKDNITKEKYINTYFQNIYLLSLFFDKNESTRKNRFKKTSWKYG